MLRLTALTLVIPLLATAQGDFAVDRATLPNGLDILLHVDRKAPTVHVNLRIRAGSKNEKPGQYGLAHLVEHLFYEDRDGNPLSNQLERLGATNFCGDLNDDFTEFCATIPSGRLESICGPSPTPSLCFSRTSPSTISITSAKSSSMSAVKGSKMSRITSSVPSLRNNSFRRATPTITSVGSVEDLRAVTLDRVRAFFAEHYTPDQISIAIAGDFDPRRPNPGSRNISARYPPPTSTSLRPSAPRSSPLQN